MPKKRDKDDPRRGRNLSPREWLEVEELWASGELTLQELADKFGMNSSYLSQALAKRGVEKGSKAALYKEKIEEEIQQAMIDDAAVNIRRIKESKDEHYQYSRTIARLIYTRIAQCIKEKRPIADAKDDIATLKNAMSGLQLARFDRWAITGLDREPDAGEEIPVLPIEEFTEQEIEDIKRAQDQELGIDDQTMNKITQGIDP